MTFEFTLLLEGTSKDFEATANAIYDVCDDALVAECRGVTSVEFCREAPTFEKALLSTLTTLINHGFKVSRIEPNDLVGETEIARRIGHSRQSVHQYVNGDRGPGAFPLPTADVSGSRPLWHWHEVLAWLVQHSIWGDQSALDIAESIAMANAALELLRHPQHQRILAALKEKAA